MPCYSDTQMAAALRLAGVGAGDAAFLVATAHPESGGCGVQQQGQPYSTTGWGPWQITPGNSEPQCGTNAGLFGLRAAACAAEAKLKSQGLGAWTTITSGAYASFFGSAKNAVSAVYGMPISQVNQLASSAGAGNAQTTGFHIPNPLTGLENLGQTIVQGFVSSVLGGLGVPSLKDFFIRGGLIVFGAILVIAGIVMLTSKAVSSVAVDAIAAE